MANTRISDLTASASNLASTDLAPVVQTAGVGPVKMTGLQLAGGLLGSTTFNGATSAGTALGTVAITGTGGQFSCAAATLAVGQNVTISGTLGGTGSITGYSNPTTYRISATNGSTTFTLVNASTGAALTTTAGTPTGLTYVVTSPVVNFTQTWNNSAVTFTGLRFNATDTASASGSLLLDLQVGGTSRFYVTKNGEVNARSGGYNVPSVSFGTTGSYIWGSGTTFAFVNNGGGTVFTASAAGLVLAGSDDCYLRRAAAATLQLGAADAAGSAIAISSVASNQLTLASSHGLSNGAAIIITGTAAPSGTTLNTLYYARSISAAVLELYDTYENAITTSGTTGRVSVTTAGTSASVRLSTPFQTFQPQSFTGTDIPGQPFIIKGSRGTGTGAGGSIIFQVAPAGSSGTAQNAYSTALTINDNRTVTPNLALRAVNGFGLLFRNSGDGNVLKVANGAFPYAINAASNLPIGWASTTNPDADNPDTMLWRDGAPNTLALRNGTNAQTFNVYGSYTGATNYQRVVVKTLREVSSALSGATYVSTIAIPAYALLVGVTTRVNTAITGATSYSVGDGTTANLWGDNIGIALNSQSRTSDFTAVGAVGAAATSRTVTLTANGSNFTGGVVEICLHYLTTEAD